MRNSSAAIATIVIGLISGPTMRAQATETQPRFDAADVHLSPPATNPYTYTSGGVLRGGRYDLRKATMLDLIKTAWNIDPETVFGGPDWLELDRFDISAKAPLQTRPETLRLMLQALLKDRFGLVVHEDTRPLPAFALTVGKNKPGMKESKLTASSGSGPAVCDNQPQTPPVMFAVYACRNMTMDQLALKLPQLAGAYLTIPVLNETGLEGAWDFDLKWNGRFQMLPPEASRITIFGAVEQQLGLALELKTAPAPVLVVDRARKPTPNPPGTEKLLPPRSVQFEVADLKMSRPDETSGAAKVTSDRFEMRNDQMDGLIGYAFDIDFDHVDELVAGLPKGIKAMHLDINAKLPVETRGESSIWADDDLRLMVRNLLIERFKIKYHYEDRVTPACSLISAKPKMKKADPSHRSSCQNARTIANDPRDSHPRLNRLVDCRNVTMAQFATLLQGFAPDYLATPVEDATRLQGAYDFTLNFTGSYQLTAPASGDGTSPSDPNGAISLFDAVNKQLGLKLEKRPRPVPIIVIDHMEEKPAEN